ncbi:FxLYD domain-containing protein [Halalkalicoccus tibetensis]|uniref:FxLYD domain-containing protein n=1 Tax=Halalkalicoccus tibetensis TaxID=175632 RepID=A0ABD5V387_9EURY
MRRRDLLASTVAACTLAGCVGNGDDEDEPEEPEDPDDSDDPEEPDEEEPEDPEEGERVEIVESELVREEAGTDGESVVVRGVVAPRDDVEEDVEVNYVEVRAAFHDAEGETLDTIIEQVEIDPEVDQWGFEVSYPHIGERAAEVEDYELEVGTEL